MTEQTTTAPILSGRIVVDADAPREEWLDARATGVTASRILDIAAGGRKAWRAVLDGQLNGETFRGNRQTARGHERERVLIDFAVATVDASIEPNSALWAAADESRFLATPDALGDSFGVEVKSHEKVDKIERSIPRDHYAQMQWGMRVTGYRRWLYVREAVGADGERLLEDPVVEWVEYDGEFVAWLEDRARAYLAWRDADCPAVDEMPDDVAAALADWAQLKADLDPLAKREAAAKKKLAALLARLPHASYGVVLMGEHGGVQMTAAGVRSSIDEDRLGVEAPELAAQRSLARASLDAVEARIADRFTVEKPSAGSIRFDAPAVSA